MELKAYLAILWRRKFIILLTLVITVMVTMIGLQFIRPIYQSSITLRLATAASGSAEWVNYNLDYTDRLMNTYATFVTNEAVIAELMERLESKEAPNVEAAVSANTELMMLTVEHVDPTMAAEAAQLLGEILVEQSAKFSAESTQAGQVLLAERLAQLVQELPEAPATYANLPAELADPAARSGVDLVLETGQEQYDRLVREYEQMLLRNALQTNVLSIVTPALLPEHPTKPNVLLTLLLGVLLGGIGGLGLAFVAENLDTVLYTSEQIESAAGFPVIGGIPRLDQTLIQEEHFSYLCTRLIPVSPEASPCAFLITSAEPEEGKSTIASNLAIAFARTGRTVALVDCDLRLPAIHALSSLPNKSGVSTVLECGVTVSEVLQTGIAPGLRIITSGPLPDSPAVLLALPAMAALVQQLRKQFDVILFDSPALLAVADAALLAPLMDGVILVAKRGNARQETIKQVCQGLTALNAAVIGLVVNYSRPNKRYQHYYRRKSKVS